MTMKHKLYTLLGVTGVSLAMATAAQAEINFNGEFSGDLTATSTYMWRGVPQTVAAALQGGVKYADPTGVHVGAWTSNVSFEATIPAPFPLPPQVAVVTGSEIDLILGYAGKTNGIEYDAGFIMYRYPQAGAGVDVEFEEIYVGASQGSLSAQFSSSSDMGEYFEIAGEFPVKSWGMTAHFGHYSVDAGPDYADYSVTFSKPVKDFDLSVMLSDTDRDGDKYRTTISLSTTFKP